MTTLTQAVNQAGCLLNSQLEQFLVCYHKPLKTSTEEDQFQAIIKDTQQFNWDLAQTFGLDQLDEDLLVGGLYLASSQRLVKTEPTDGIEVYDIVVLKHTVPKTFEAIRASLKANRPQ